MCSKYGADEATQTEPRGALHRGACFLSDPASSRECLALFPEFAMLPRHP